MKFKMPPIDHLPPEKQEEIKQIFQEVNKLYDIIIANQEAFGVSPLIFPEELDED